MIAVGVPTQAAGLTGAQVIEKAVAQLEGVRDASLDLTVEQYDPGSGRRLGAMAGRLDVVVDPSAVRFTLTEPAALAGQIMMVDGVKGQVAIYSPVTEQVMVQPLSQFGQQFGSSFGLFGGLAQSRAGAAGAGSHPQDLRALLQLPSSSRQPATLVRTENVGGNSVYVVDVVNTQVLMLQRFWVKAGDYRVLRIETYDARNRLTSRVNVSRWQTNSGLQAGKLLKWPAGATQVSMPN